MEKWHAAKPGSIVDGKPAPKEPRPKPVPVSESRLARRRSRSSRSRRRQRAAAVHGRLRRGPGRGGQARQARDRHHRGDGGRHRPRQARRRRCPSSTTTSASPSRTPSCSPPGSRSRAPSRSARSTRPSSSGPSTRSSTTSACRSSNVVFAMDRAGLVGDDGPTHHGAFDVSYFRPLPQRRRDGAARRGDARPHAAHRARLRRRARSPSATRAAPPRARRCRTRPRRSRSARARCCCRASSVALLGYGYGVQVALRAAELLREQGLEPDRRRRPLRQAARRRAGRAAGGRPRAAGHDRGERPAPAASAPPCSSTSRTPSRPRIARRVMRIGLPDRYVTHGKPRCCAKRSASPASRRRAGAQRAGLAQPDRGLASFSRGRRLAGRPAPSAASGRPMCLPVSKPLRAARR